MKVCVRIDCQDQERFLAFCPSLPGCTSEGRTREEAEQKIHEAILGYLAAVGNFVPATLVHEVSEA